MDCFRVQMEFPDILVRKASLVNQGFLWVENIHCCLNYCILLIAE